MHAIANVGSRTINWLAEFGDFCRFAGQAIAAVPAGLSRWRRIRLILAQMYEIGTRSLPVVMVTGAFVGMVRAVQAVVQFHIKDPDLSFVLDMSSKPGKVTEGTVDAADTTVTLSDEDLESLAKGEFTMRYLFLHGNVVVDGDVGPASRMGFLEKLG